MSDIFISYASADRQIAQTFATAFEKYGWSVWWDREIPVGRDFDQVIEEELNAARCVVVLWSRAAVRSRWVQTEASAAADKDRLVPVSIDEVPIPLEFKRIQTAMLPDWNGDMAHPDFQRSVQSIKELIGRTEPGARRDPVGRTVPPETASTSTPRSAPSRVSPRVLGAIAAALLIVAGLFVARNLLRGPGQGSTPVASNDRATNDAAKNTGGTANKTSAPAPANPSGLPSPSQTGGFAIKIGDRIGEGVPDRGAGSIGSPYALNVYSFPALAGQRVYFRMLHNSNGLAYIRWRLTDADGMEMFNTCLSCPEPGVQILTRGGTYTLTVGSDKDPGTGTYQLQLFDVPPPDRFTIKIGDVVKDSTPGPGAGSIESPGAEDIYTFTATPRQNVYFRMFETSNGLSYLKWKLVDDNGMEIFNACLGCPEPGVQTLIRGGNYTLTVGNRTDPSTGTYRLQLLNVPPPNQFAIRIGEKVSPGVPGPGAGIIESPGAEDMYVFSVGPGQKAYFHMVEHDKAMDYLKWRLVSESSTEVFNACLGCPDPGVQTLTKGGKYTLIVGSRTNPSTGNYAFETGSR